jgi:hypothetical protein
VLILHSYARDKLALDCKFLAVRNCIVLLLVILISVYCHIAIPIVLSRSDPGFGKGRSLTGTT